MLLKNSWLLLLFLLAACAPQREAARENDGTNENIRQEIVRLVNDYRRQGYKNYPPVPAVRWNNKLANAARTQSAYMNSKNILSHAGSRGSNAGNRINAAGYKWSYYGENIAMGQPTARQVMQSWVNSPGHLKNIMNGKMTEIGAAHVGKYWTLVLARP